MNAHAWNDQSELVPVTPFDFTAVDDAAEPELNDPNAARKEALLDLLQFLALPRSSKRVGARVLMLAHILGVGGCLTQRELARALGVGESRVSQALKSLRRELLNAGAGFDNPPVGKK